MVSITGVRSKRMSKETKLSKGQGLIEFAIVLPILVLIVFGVLELGRAFFAYIAISNAAREGTRVFTFRPDVTKVLDIQTAVITELGTSPLVNKTKITAASIYIECGSVPPYHSANNDVDLKTYCLKNQSIRVTVTYIHDLIFRLFLPPTIMLRQSAEMMVP